MSPAWDPLSPEARAAIAAYAGPVTICPPRTFSEDANDWIGRGAHAGRAKMREQARAALAAKRRQRRFAAAARIAGTGEAEPDAPPADPAPMPAPEQAPAPSPVPGRAPRKRPRRLPEVVRPAFAAAAEPLGVTAEALARPRSDRLRWVRNAVIACLLERGMTVTALARALGCQRATVATAREAALRRARARNRLQQRSDGHARHV